MINLVFSYDPDPQKTSVSLKANKAHWVNSTLAMSSRSYVQMLLRGKPPDPSAPVHKAPEIAF